MQAMSPDRERRSLFRFRRTFVMTASGMAMPANPHDATRILHRMACCASDMTTDFEFGGFWLIPYST